MEETAGPDRTDRLSEVSPLKSDALFTTWSRRFGRRRLNHVGSAIKLSVATREIISLSRRPDCVQVVWSPTVTLGKKLPSPP